MISRPASNIVSHAGRFSICLILILALIYSIVVPKVLAADYPKLPNRSLNIGDTTPDATTTYAISYQFPAPTNIGSVRFEICTTHILEDPCINPSADLSGAALISQTGINDFSILSQSTGEILMTRTSSFAGTVQSTYTFNNIDNPAGLEQRFYIRISTYVSEDGTGLLTHFSSVASATTNPIVINSEVPPILYFCAALFVTDWCDSVGGNFIDYGDLSSVQEDAAVSQFGVATNALGGYVVTANGNTMTAGTRIIQNITSLAPNTPGTPQFGINLRANTNPANGQDVFGPGVGAVAAGYDSPDMFQYNDGDMVAYGLTGSLFDTFTVTYIVNVPSTQPAGVYNTTITYICTAFF